MISSHYDLTYDKDFLQLPVSIIPVLSPEVRSYK